MIEASPQEATNYVVSSGILPRVSHTVFGAELLAVNVALAYEGSSDIFCDNQAAVRFKYQLQNQGEQRLLTRVL